ncbi:MAG: hypothetical protein GF346_04980, partial [Candidatus Eisenbacteria bacterium]|nr:hypothetical protein [Candidatus Latescibacterota bacterium]MBD3301780.1 hypothetical protein [Candidatus Eisenbacteria bacterium]
LPAYAMQSTGVVPSDVPREAADRHRLRVALRACRKPVVTGTFHEGSFEAMRRMLACVRGGEEELRERPLAIFDCCPSPPLAWSALTTSALIECAAAGIPAELVSMPMTGATAPVTLLGAITQHTAENLSGLVIHQLAAPGAPLIYGGSPSAFDMRQGTTPMGAVETMMIDAAYAEVGKHLGLPVHAYMGLSDAKLPDYQAGLESGTGALLAALAGINVVSGPGMLDFESCQSLEKLVVDNEIAGMVLRMVRGIEPREDFPAVPRFEELLAEGHLLISKHTRTHLRAEQILPGPAIDRANRSRWLEEGGSTIGQRARREVDRRIAAHEPVPLSGEVVAALEERMAAEARRVGMPELPARAR